MARRCQSLPLLSAVCHHPQSLHQPAQPRRSGVARERPLHEGELLGEVSQHCGDVALRDGVGRVQGKDRRLQIPVAVEEEEEEEKEEGFSAVLLVLLLNINIHKLVS